MPHPHEVPHQSTEDLAEVPVTEEESRTDYASRSDSALAQEDDLESGLRSRGLTGNGERDGPEEVNTLVQVVDKGAGRLRSGQGQSNARRIYRPPHGISPEKSVQTDDVQSSCRRNYLHAS